MKTTNLLIGLFLSLSTLVAQEITEPTLIKAASTNPVDIPYEKWELPNGLKVLIHEDHSDPIVHVHVTYHVGSNRETAGKSGFAHFFEHMMFQGSENGPDEVAPRIIAEAGGRLNGTTNSDRTVYFQRQVFLSFLLFNFACATTFMRGGLPCNQIRFMFSPNL